MSKPDSERYIVEYWSNKAGCTLEAPFKTEEAALFQAERYVRKFVENWCIVICPDGRRFQVEKIEQIRTTEIEQ